MALRAIKNLATDAKRDFKKKKVYRMHCENLIEKWIPELKRVYLIHGAPPLPQIVHRYT